MERGMNRVKGPHGPVRRWRSFARPAFGRLLAAALCASAAAACSSWITPATGTEDGGTSPDAGAAAADTGDPFDVPINGVTRDLVTQFNAGDDLFDIPLREPDGLGPLYTRTACGACHQDAARGPGLVQKMTVVLTDGITPAPDQTVLAFGHTVHPLVAAGAKTPIVAPGDPSVKVSIRVGPPVLGRGYMEAILDSEIERVEAEQAARADAIHGRANRVFYASEANTDTRFHTHQKGDVVIGRFGVKARIATLDDFTADALQGDMGITSPLRPEEIVNPDGLTDDLKPGVDATMGELNARAMYMRLIAIPRRKDSGSGAAAFTAAKCGVCHVPSMKTRADYPIGLLANIDAPVYTDLLLHDMGPGLADGSADGVDGAAHSREWRTAPLIGLRFDKAYMHDSRARTIHDAILAHDSPGSQATESVQLYNALPAADHAALLDFVGSL